MSSIPQENSDQEQPSNSWNFRRFILSLFMAEDPALRGGDSGSTANNDIAQQNEDALQLLATRDSATDIESDAETGGTGQEDADDFVIVTGSDYDTDDDDDWETVVGSEQDNDSQNRDDILKSPMPQQHAQPRPRPRHRPLMGFISNYYDTDDDEWETVTVSGSDSQHGDDISESPTAWHAFGHTYRRQFYLIFEQGIRELLRGIIYTQHVPRPEPESWYYALVSDWDNGVVFLPRTAWFAPRCFAGDVFADDQKLDDAPDAGQPPKNGTSSSGDAASEVEKP